VGTMARWRGDEFFADVQSDTALLTMIGDGAPAGFEQIRPGAWSATVGSNECEIFERVFTGTLEGVPVRLLRRTGPHAEVLLLSDDPAAAARCQARLVEPGVYEAIVDASRLANVQGIENQLAPSPE
jgi:hypothetical protein